MAKRLKSGDILEIPLAKYERGYAYAKFVDIREIIENTSYVDLIRVYDYISETPLESIRHLTNRELLLNPLVVNGVRVGLKSLDWRVVGAEPLTVEDKRLPSVKNGMPFTATSLEEVKRWYILRNAGKTMGALESDLAGTADLECAGATDAEYVPFRIVHELYRIEGKDIAEYLELDFMEKHMYWQTNTTTIMRDRKK